MKREQKLLLILAVMLFTALSATAKRQPAIISKADSKAMNAWVDATLKAMTPEERIAQLMVAAVDPRAIGTEDRVKKLVTEYKVGGLIYNEADLTTVAKTTNMAQQQARVPLLITIDAEWGLSMRLEDAPKFPRNLYLGAIGDDQLFYDYGREVARECRRIGVNVDFAPVLDVIDRPGTVVGSRSFGSNPELVSRHAIAFARGLEDGGVLSVGKHFPGHGSCTADSHKTLPTVDKSMHELQMVDFVPFRRYIDAGLGAMLTAHLNVPAVDKKSGLPGTMNPKMVNGLLKKKMGFQGLIFTDALDMEGAKAAGRDVCVQALLAGNDVLLMPADIGGEIAAVKAAVANGTLKQSQIDEHVKKVLRYKYAMGLSKTPQVSLDGLVRDVNSDYSSVLRRQLTAASITVVRNQNDILPLKNLPSRHIAVVTMGNDNGTQSLFTRRCKDYAECDSFDFSGNVSTLSEKLKAGSYNCIIISIAQRNHSYVRAARYLASHFRNVIVTVMADPDKLDTFGPVLADSYVAASLVAYENTTTAEDYLAQTIFGGNGATGVLPVDVKTGRKEGDLHAGTGVSYKATRLGYTIPAEVGFKSNLLAKIDSICNYGVREHAFPGCQVVVARHGKVVCNRAYGQTAYDSGIPVTTGTIYGLASVSKATGTLSAVMEAYDQDKFKLDDKASDYIPGLKGTNKEDITFRELLYHETGMPPSLNMWYMMFDPATYSGPLITAAPSAANSIKIMNGAYGNRFAKLRTDILSTEKTDVFNVPIAQGIWGSQATYDSIMARIYRLPLGEKRYLYSCLNFCLLANAVQNMTKLPLNYYVNNTVFAPLGAYHTMYRPLSKFPSWQIAYTEVDTYLRRQHIHGYVHDELAAFSGGVQGNAGLFSNANDLAKLFQMWLNGGTYGGQRFLKLSTVETFTTQKSPNSHRGLGFDKPVVGNPKASSTCAEATPETFGHTGFTGTCFWVDPKNDMIYIFLSNRVSPTRNNPNFGRVSARTHIQSLLYHSIVK